MELTKDVFLARETVNFEQFHTVEFRSYFNLTIFNKFKRIQIHSRISRLSPESRFIKKPAGKSSDWFLYETQHLAQMGCAAYIQEYSRVD